MTDTALAIVKEYHQEGRFIKTIGRPGNLPGYFARPKGIAIDPQGRLYVADAQWEIVQAFSSDGQLLIYFGGASTKPEGMGLPAGLATDATSLDVFRRFVSKDSEAEHLLFVVNQFGPHELAR